MHALSERDSELARQVLEHDDRDRSAGSRDRSPVHRHHRAAPTGRARSAFCDLGREDGAGARAHRRSRLQHRARRIDLNNEPELKSVLDLSAMAEHALVDVARGAGCFYFQRRDRGARDHQERHRDQRSLQPHLSSPDRNDGDRAGHSHARRALLFVAKHLERIGDYVTDICELTVYMAEAAFIKHYTT